MSQVTPELLPMPAEMPAADLVGITLRLSTSLETQIGQTLATTQDTLGMVRLACIAIVALCAVHVVRTLLGRA